MAINTIATQGAYASGLQQKQQTMNKLFSALKAGDMVSAQKAYAASGLPPMAKNNTSPLGRLYQALMYEDLAASQKAALEMQPRKNGKASTTVVASAASTVPTKSTAAQKAAAALASASITAQQSSVFAMMGVGSRVNTVA